MPPIYDLYVTDSRYSVPTLQFLTAASEGRARARATEILLESPFHLSVELRRDDQLLCTIECGRKPLPAPSQTTSPPPQM
jgi:hypothetical protein